MNTFLVFILSDVAYVYHVNNFKMPKTMKGFVHTHYYNSDLIWRTVSHRVDEVIPSDHPKCEALRMIQWYGLIHKT